MPSVFLFLFAATSLFADPMTQSEREHLIFHLEMTQTWLTDEVSSQSAPQLNFRPAPDRWTVAEVVQHLVIAEPNYWKLLNDAAQALQAFLKMHAQLLELARSTNEDLRGHAVPEWGVDAYQCLLEISTHEQRHILQIREIKASPGFPKK